MDKVNMIEKGTQIVKEAIKKDHNGQYEEALRLYNQGIQYLQKALKYEKNQKITRAIQYKLQTFQKRIEALTQRLDPNDIIDAPSSANASNIYTQSPLKSVMFTAMDQTSIHLVSGYCLNVETLLPNTPIPTEIVTVIINYYYIFPCGTIQTSRIQWSDIIGLKDAKTRLKEAVIIPLRFPQLFKSRMPYKGILLYGPNGCGKSHLINGCLTELNSKKIPMFYIRFADLISIDNEPWPEKPLENVYAMAKNHSPSIVCLHGIQHVSGAGRGVLKTILLIQMHSACTSNVITICITNEPWDIDPVIRKRLPCRIYVKLPDNEARKDLFKMYIDALPIHTTLLDSDYETLAEKTNGFTCDEIYCIVQDTHHHAEAFESLSFVDIITTADNTKASVTKEDIQRLHDWTQDFGCS
eukprot:398941_1